MRELLVRCPYGKARTGAQQQPVRVSGADCIQVDEYGEAACVRVPEAAPRPVRPLWSNAAIGLSKSDGCVATRLLAHYPKVLRGAAIGSRCTPRVGVRSFEQVSGRIVLQHRSVCRTIQPSSQTERVRNQQRGRETAAMRAKPASIRVRALAAFDGGSS